MKNLIFHIDVNSAFLSWEAVYRLAHKGGSLPEADSKRLTEYPIAHRDGFLPEAGSRRTTVSSGSHIACRGHGIDLREIPSAVGGDVTKRHGIILAKSIPAKKHGIQTGDTILEARRKCPNIVLVPPNYDLYRECSAAFLDILREYSDVVEPYSIDEAFVDMTTTCHLFGAPEEAAARIKDRIREELGFTVNIGISDNKLLAKMASDFRKPDLVHTLYREEIREKMWPLPVPDLFFVGRATAKKLASMGLATIGDIAGADPAWLRAVLKKPGEAIWGFANGIDLSPVLAAPTPNKGYGNSTTTPFDVTDAETANLVLLALSETLGSRLRANGAKIGVVSVAIRYSDLSYFSHQKTLTSPTDLTLEIYHAAKELFPGLWDRRPIRHLGVHTGGARYGAYGRQISLFDEINYEKLAVMDRTVDTLRQRFGRDAVKRAVFLNQPVSHMCGGVP